MEKLRSQIKQGNHIIGVATGSGMTAKYAQNAGADFLLMLNSGRFRQMGRGALWQVFYLFATVTIWLWNLHQKK